MPIVTQLAGFILLMIGAGAFLASGMDAGGMEITALIPAVFGAALLGAGMLAEKDEGKRRHALHAALVVALLGVAGTLPMALGSGGMRDASDMARIEAALTALVCLMYLGAGIRSFAAARRARS